MTFFASTAANHNDLAADEALRAGAEEKSIRIVPGGVEFSGNLETGYRFCLWSRTASRLLLLLGTGDNIETGDQLHHRAMQVPWFEHLSLKNSFAVHATVRKSRWLKNSQFGALKVKDAIADQFREIYDTRPSVDTENPDIIFHLHMDGIHGYFYLDLTGRSLHKRGYRRSDSSVSLKEHLAAALLLRAGWPEKAAGMKPLIDPFCGTGTIPIEAALMASDTAPGLLQPDSFAFLSWKGHDAELWKSLLTEAEERREKGMSLIPKISGWDISSQEIQAAESHAKNAGLESYISFTVQDASNPYADTIPIDGPGVIVSDPPYGIRMGIEADLRVLYKNFGNAIANNFPGWQVSLLAGEPELLREIKLRPDSTNILYNGAIKCTVAHYTIFDRETRNRLTEKAEAKQREREEAELSPGAEMFANRLKKNKRMLKAFLKRSKATSYRLYDADMPEYSAAIDIYEDKWVHLQEYAPPAEIELETAETRLLEMIDGVNRVTGIPYDYIFVKQRKRQRGKSQYNRRTSRGQTYIMKEQGLKFFVNFTDYIDTGIFLDHRPARQKIRELSNNKRFLNLFGYTGTATVYAAAGGALSTVTVDTSKTYLAWAEKNLELNGFTGMGHQFYISDCMEWLHTQSRTFDLIFMDPPTYSNSKSRTDDFDIQRDHRKLIVSAMRHLEKDGILVFSNNFRKFEMDEYIMEKYLVEEITHDTIPDDFLRTKHIHRCWIIQYRGKNITPRKVLIKKSTGQTKPGIPRKKPRVIKVSDANSDTVDGLKLDY
ncbi:MAG: bifunctional 23S rRNA (guanine(2069)-N(7))-methyltransferase RlmK/23S rRNA (guanine(2445)-N(2))-methyltransferase RlmL [Spirochaetales bacterium]|nr:bifunctional 23S rRNA (guanine(2069)-N(7))-methyltransferase RlmK/23S rRNA (guanine(2445)-N(2))-methyltransferase RlmL [Spirochaetales bacterium]